MAKKISVFTGNGEAKEIYENDSVNFFKGGEMSVTPMHDRVLIKPLDPEMVSSGGIIIPESARTTSTKGIVVAVGDGFRDKDGDIIPLKVKVDDVVIYTQSTFGLVTLNIGSQEVIVIRESDIIGIINN
jgi:chaperonin GroES